MGEIYFMFNKQSGNSELCLNAVSLYSMHRDRYADQCRCVVTASLVNAKSQSEKGDVSHMNHLPVGLCKMGRWQR